MARWRLIPPLLFLLLASACKKESEIAKELVTGKKAGQHAYQMLAIWTVAEEFAFGRWEDFSSKQVELKAIDSLFIDGDGIIYEMNFGNGMVCIDGIKRSGKCTITLSHQNFPVEGELIWQSDTTHPFAFVRENEKIELQGIMKLHVFSSDSTQLTFDVTSNEGNETIRSYTGTEGVYVLYEQPIQANRKGTTWNGMWTTILNGGPSANVTAKMLHNHSGCFSLWNAGRISVFDSNNEAFELNIDPYSTGACDLEFSVTKGKGLNSLEMVFKAW